MGIAKAGKNAEKLRHGFVTQSIGGNEMNVELRAERRQRRRERRARAVLAAQMIFFGAYICAMTVLLIVLAGG